MLEYFSRRVQAGKYAIILLATLAPPVALALSAYDVAGTHYVAAHLLRTNPRTGDVSPGDIVAVTGRVTGTPARLTADGPRFVPALMVVRRFETYHHGKRGGWRISHTDVWMSESAVMAGWLLTGELIQHAGFDKHRASPCSDYRPPVGWGATCPGDQFSINKADEDQRFSYEVTPFTSEDYTLIAAVAEDGYSLGSIMSETPDEHSPGSVLAHGAQDPKAVLAARAAQGHVAIAISWAFVFLVAGCWMFVALGRNGSYAGLQRPGLQRLWGVVWRSAIIGAPFVTFCLGFPPDFVIVADVVAATIGAGLGGFFWFRAIEG